jgi:tRNA G18 (ribose-2'-O)-methylase SpoU
MAKQLKHNEYKHNKKKNDVFIVLDNLEHLENIGSAFRIADALAVKKIFIIDDKNLFNQNDNVKIFKKINKTARSCTKYVQYKILTSIEYVNLSKTQEITNISLEITDESKSVENINFADFKHLSIIVGNEKNGISQLLIDNSSFSTHINMFGNNSSMNVTTALSIALYKVNSDIEKLAIT